MSRDRGRPEDCCGLAPGSWLAMRCAPEAQTCSKDQDPVGVSFWPLEAIVADAMRVWLQVEPGACTGSWSLM